jgi:SAM-dependent methyltransferase
MSSRLRKRLFAWGMRHGGKRYRRMVADRVAGLLAQARGSVLELGVGVGASLPLLPRGVDYVGIDSNPYMLRHARATAERCDLPARFARMDAARLALPKHHFDTVLAMLVLCSVEDPARVLAEVRRVLQPGGRFLFMEHVAAAPGSRTRKWQERTAPLWRVVGDGCCPARDTAHTIRMAGFAQVEFDVFEVSVPIFSPHVVGVAVRA